MDIPELDRLLDNEYLGDLSTRSIEEIRAMRAESQTVETGLSYVRRLAQGRLDIVAADLRRRREGGDPPDLHSLVDHLPEILGEGIHAPGVGRLPTLMAPGDDEVTRQLTARLDAIVDANTLGALEQLDDGEALALTSRLADLERQVSARRQALFTRIDALQAELTRRYKTGEASVESLLK
jgi:hypothetical protein